MMSKILSITNCIMEKHAVVCIMTKRVCRTLPIHLVNIFHQTGGGLYIVSEKAHFSWYLLQIWKILMRHVTFKPLLFWIAPDLFHVFLYEEKKISVVHIISRHFSLYTFYLFEHINSGWWIVTPKGLLSKDTRIVCVAHEEKYAS